jgi:AcrR family transcriptional regulator
MPYPSQTNREQLIQQARLIIEGEGVELLSLAKLAALFGVKAPSLYKHFDSKAALLQAVNLQTALALVARLRAVVDATPGDMRARLLAMTQAYRAFALSNPQTYALLFGNLPPALRPDPARLEALALPLQSLMAQVAGEAASLPMLRGIWALAHGFVTLELNGQFQRGGDLEATFIEVVARYLQGWM